MSPAPGQAVGAPMICGRQYEANIILLLVERCTSPSQSTHHIQRSKIKKYRDLFRENSEIFLLFLAEHHGAMAAGCVIYGVPREPGILRMLSPAWALISWRCKVKKAVQATVVLRSSFLHPPEKGNDVKLCRK